MIEFDTIPSFLKFLGFGESLSENIDVKITYETINEKVRLEPFRHSFYAISFYTEITGNIYSEGVKIGPGKIRGFFLCSKSSYILAIITRHFKRASHFIF